jgi:hypothetical protein
MRNRIGKCKRTSCSSRCGVRIAVRECKSSEAVQFATKGLHVPGRRPTPRFRHSKLFKDLVKDCFYQHPARILKEWSRSHPRDKCPSLKSVQNLVARLKRKEFANSEARVLEYLDALPFSTADPSVVYSFRKDNRNRKLVEDENLVIGFTNLNSLRNLERAVENGREMMLHVDATYNLNNCGFPLVVVGVSDAMGHLHVVAMFLVRNETADSYKLIFFLLQREVRNNLNMELEPHFVMSDAAKSIAKAVGKKFPESLHMLCYFHVKQACKRKAKGNWRRIGPLLDKIHFSRNAEEFEAIFSDVLGQLNTLDTSFASYFKKNWKKKPWQIFHVPPAFCTTNNPLEQLNRSLKATHIVRKTSLVECMRGLVGFLGESQIEFKNERYRLPELERKWEAHFPDFDIAARDGALFRVLHRPSGKSVLCNTDECPCPYKRKWGDCIHNFYVQVKEHAHRPHYRRGFSNAPTTRGRPIFHNSAPLIFM